MSARLRLHHYDVCTNSFVSSNYTSGYLTIQSRDVPDVRFNVHSKFSTDPVCQVSVTAFQERLQPVPDTRLKAHELVCPTSGF